MTGTGTRRVAAQPARPGGGRPALTLAGVVMALAGPGRWAEDALCAQADPDAWYPDKGGSPAAAKRICAACPARVPCLDYALAGADTWGGISTGIWAGTTPRERAALRRQRKAAAA